ncbi:Kinase-like protein [Mycena sanguinolenta]|uniref:Class E vacuolar protein-sorting machinery protein HSE1 n=1 Tax=Mycena sanguinolenta TaxID=230812 RepID=A0A8H6Z6W9_9AGAR|nr:Kinase-like protein [Mycena sanguinolenta]
MQKESKHLDFESSQLNPVKLADLLQRLFPISAAHGLATNRESMLPKILIHESLLSFLHDACSTRLPGRNLSEVAHFKTSLDDYTLSMASNNVVSAIVGSLESRRTLLELASQLGLANDPKLRAAQRTDDERIATILVSIFDSKDEGDTVLRLEGDPAQHFLDVIQETLDKGLLLAEDHSRMARRLIRKLSERCDMLPSSLFITGVSGREEHPTFGGGYGDIFRASYNEKPVALKRMRYFLRGAELRRVHLKFCREALVWKDLRHPHILSFLGIDRDSFPSTLCMVSPWMEHGTVLSYLQKQGHASVDKLLYEIAQGLQYLHSCNIVHGDLRGANILINENWSACLTDFGLSNFSDATSSMTTNRGGSLYWMAPELIDPDRFGLQFARTPATDVYAFGCVCLELYTGRPPFADLREPAALLKITNNERPQRPVGPPVVSDKLWNHVSACWADDPQARPGTQLVVQTMKALHPLPLLPNQQSPPPSPPMPSYPPTPMAVPNVLPHVFLSQSFADDISPGADSRLVGDEYKILHDYTTPTDDPTEMPMSFHGGEIVHLLQQEGLWCEVMKEDQSIGVVPSHFLILASGSPKNSQSDGHDDTERTEISEDSQSDKYLDTERTELWIQGQRKHDDVPAVRVREGNWKKIWRLGTTLLERDKRKVQGLPPPPAQQTPAHTPIHQQFVFRSQSQADEDRWEMLDQHTPPLPPGTGAPVPSPTSTGMQGARSPSPYSIAPSTVKPGLPTTLRKKPPPVIGILHSLDVRRRKGGGFWNRDKDKDKEREREREREREQRERVERAEMEREAREQMRGGERRDEEIELTRKIEFLTAAASEDWTLVLDVCDHASASEASAKEAVRALRRYMSSSSSLLSMFPLLYALPILVMLILLLLMYISQLWAIMLRNSTETFISQCTGRKFLDTLEDLLTSKRTSPVVRERVMDVLAAAAYASGSNITLKYANALALAEKDASFRGLWRRVKPPDKPEEGVPFDSDDAMLNSLLTSPSPVNV